MSFVVVALGAALVGCADQRMATTVPFGGSDPGEQPASPASPPIDSPKSNVRFLNTPRMQLSFAQTLGLPPDFCKELGIHSCFDLVHRISLLGTEPYELGVDDPMTDTGASAPMAAERVALIGCTQRVAIDLSKSPSVTKIGKVDRINSSARIFHRISIDSSGRMDENQAEVAIAIDALYVRRMQRHATLTEIDHFKQLYRDIAQTTSTTPASDWAVASCGAVLTSIESLFY
jgi:hypothetical protein